MARNRCKTVDLGKRVAPFEPGGLPSATLGVGSTEVEVMMTPDASVIMKVAKVGEAETVGIAEALIEGTARRGAYVLVPSSEFSI